MSRLVKVGQGWSGLQNTFRNRGIARTIHSWTYAILRENFFKPGPRSPLLRGNQSDPVKALGECCGIRIDGGTFLARSGYGCKSVPRFRARHCGMFNAV